MEKKATQPMGMQVSSHLKTKYKKMVAIFFLFCKTMLISITCLCIAVLINIHDHLI